MKDEMKWEAEFDEPTVEELADAATNPKAYGLDEDGFPNAETFNAMVSECDHSDGGVPPSQAE